MLMEEVRHVHRENFGVYGVRKVWLRLGREGSLGIERQLITSSGVFGSVGNIALLDLANRRVEIVATAAGGRRWSGPSRTPAACSTVRSREG